jgi:outer membrane receptor protein involved in Fe transport
VPPALQRVTGFTTDTNNYEYVKDELGRLATQVDASWFAAGWGRHAFKAGVQADWTTNDANRGQKANVVGLFWNRALLGVRGKYGYYRITTNSQDPRRGQIFIGKAEGSAAGLFVQDDWTLSRRLTVNAGLRTERETVPRYALPGGDTSPVIEFDFSQKLAPRLGAAYDVRGDGRWKLYASWGIFYDIF